MPAQPAAQKRDAFPQGEGGRVFPPDERGASGIEVLEINVAVGIEDRLRHSGEIARNAHAFEMDDLHAAIVDDSPPAARHANAQIEIVAIHEKSLVKHGPVWGHLALVGSRLYVRDKTDVICYDLLAK